MSDQKLKQLLIDAAEKIETYCEQKKCIDCPIEYICDSADPIVRLGVLIKDQIK